MKASNRLIAVIVGLALLVSLLLFSMTYSVRFNEVALVTTFSKAGSEKAVQTEPGLHFKLPAPIQGTKKFDRRLQLVDTRLDTQATKDGLLVVVQAFVMWRIDDSPGGVLKFDKSFGAIDDGARHIETRLQSALSALSEYDFNELIGPDNKLAEAEEAIQARLAGRGAGQTKTLAETGVIIESIGLSRVLLPVGTTRNVIDRMQAQREGRAVAVRDRGATQAVTIKAEATNIASRIGSHARRLASKIRADGDRLASASVGIMNEDSEFATYLIWLDALERTTAGTSTFFLPPSIPPFHLLQFNENGLAGAIPKPAGELTPTRAAVSGGERIAGDGAGGSATPGDEASPATSEGN